jgi:hypothetical protein
MPSLNNKRDGTADTCPENSQRVLVQTALMISVYLASSSVMAVLNNHVKHITGPFSLLCLQNGTTVVFIIFAGLLNLAKVEKFRLDFAKVWSPVSIAFVVMIWTSLQAGHLIGVPAVTALRNATTFFVVLSDYFILKSRVSGQCIFWLGFMFSSMIWFYLGAATAETRETSASSSSNFYRGILFLAMNVAATVVNHIYAKGIMNKNPLIDGFTIALYNNILSLIPLIPLAYHEIFLVPSVDCKNSDASSSDYSGYFLVALSSVLASILAVSSYLVQKRVQVTSFSVASNSSKILSIIINHYFPAKPEIWNINKLSGLISTLFCAFMYSWEKIARTSDASQTLARYIFPAFFVGVCALCVNGSLYFPI